MTKEYPKILKQNNLFTYVYEISDFPWFSSERFRIQKLFEILTVVKGKLVLDIGCNKGVFSKFLSKDNIVYACDIEDFSRSFNNTNVKFFCCDVEKGLPFKNNFFDVILANEILEHLKNVEFVLDEIFRVLKDEGLLIVDVPNTSWNIQSIVVGSLVPIYDFFRDKFRRKKPNYSYVTFKKRGGSDGIKKWIYVIDTYLEMMKFSKRAHILKFSWSKWAKIFLRHNFKITEVYGIGLFPLVSFLPFSIQKLIYKLERKLDDTFFGINLSSHSLFILKK
jgi:SAM-dependent methyltransferase